MTIRPDEVACANVYNTQIRVVLGAKIFTNRIVVRVYALILDWTSFHWTWVCSLPYCFLKLKLYDDC